MSTRVRGIYIWLLSDWDTGERWYYRYAEDNNESLRYAALELGVKLFI